MKKDDNHIDKLFSQKLTNLETDVPVACWETIEQAIPKSKSRTIIPLWGRIAVAAVGLFIIGTIGYWAFEGNEYQSRRTGILVKTKLTPASILLKNNKIAVLHTNEPTSNEQQQKIVNNRSFDKSYPEQSANKSVSENLMSSNDITIETDLDNTETSAIQEGAKDSSFAQVIEDRVPTKKELEAFISEAKDELPNHDKKIKTGGSHSSIGLLAALTGPQGNQNKSTFSSLRSTSKPEQFMSFLSDNQNQTENNNTSVVHDLPISLGISLEKEINNRVAVHSGICGTYLKSTQKLSTSLYFTDEIQELYYLGLPLSIAYKFAETERFSFYMKTGGMVEKNIGGRWRERVRKSGELVYTKVQHDLENRLQWSAHIGGGTNYNLSNHMKLYIEPALTYYFDNNSNIDNIHKQQRMDITIQAGLRAVFNCH